MFIYVCLDIFSQRGGGTVKAWLVRNKISLREPFSFSLLDSAPMWLPSDNFIYPWVKRETQIQQGCKLIAGSNIVKRDTQKPDNVLPIQKCFSIPLYSVHGNFIQCSYCNHENWFKHVKIANDHTKVTNKTTGA